MNPEIKKLYLHEGTIGSLGTSQRSSMWSISWSFSEGTRPIVSKVKIITSSTDVEIGNFVESYCEVWSDRGWRFLDEIIPGMTDSPVEKIEARVLNMAISFLTNQAIPDMPSLYVDPSSPDVGADKPTPTHSAGKPQLKLVPDGQSPNFKKPSDDFDMI